MNVDYDNAVQQYKIVQLVGLICTTVNFGITKTRNSICSAKLLTKLSLT